jgi:hypothetical protein
LGTAFLKKWGFSVRHYINQHAAFLIAGKNQGCYHFLC